MNHIGQSMFRLSLNHINRNTAVSSLQNSWNKVTCKEVSENMGFQMLISKGTWTTYLSRCCVTITSLTVKITFKNMSLPLLGLPIFFRFG